VHSAVVAQLWVCVRMCGRVDVWTCGCVGGVLLGEPILGVRVSGSLSVCVFFSSFSLYESVYVCACVCVGDMDGVVLACGC
jgi:hypothetical protein